MQAKGNAMSATPTFSTQILGQTERALNAILDRLLAGTGLNEPQWITLTLAVTSDEAIRRAQLISRVTGALKVGATEASALITDLVDARLLNASPGGDAQVNATDAGRQLHGQVRRSVTEITDRFWGDLDPADLDAAGRVLRTVLARANDELAD